jgi:hypothetical protein
MAPPPISLVLGNELLLAIDSEYPSNKRFKVRQHTVEAVADVLSFLNPPLGRFMLDSSIIGQSALEVFVG